MKGKGIANLILIFLVDPASVSERTTMDSEGGKGRVSDKHPQTTRLGTRKPLLQEKKWSMLEDKEGSLKKT